jgi:ABC-2 type transport system permease protein
MKTFYWLMKREFWENRGGFLWAPVVTGVVFLVLNVMAIVAAEVMRARNGIEIGGNNFRVLIERAGDGDLAQVGAALDMTMLSSMGLLTIVLAFVVFFYCLGALYDDRRDRSVLFWKSLPLSNTSTVLSKVVSAVVVAPAIAVVVGIAVGLVQLVIFSLVLSFHGINMWELLTLAHPVRAVISLLGSIPVYALWAAPAVGWLLLCSAWARSKPFLWAVAVPVVAGLMVSWFGIMGVFSLPTQWFWTNVVARLLLSVFPGSHFAMDRHALHNVSGLGDAHNPLALVSPTQTYAVLASPNLWIGVAVGAALIAAAVWFRRVRDDS